MKQKHFAIMALTALAAIFSSCEKEDTRSAFEKEAASLLGSYDLTEARWGMNEVDINGDGIFTSYLLDEYNGMPGYEESKNTAEATFCSGNGEEYVLFSMNLPFPQYVKNDTGYFVDKIIYKPVELKFKDLSEGASYGEMHKFYEMEYGVADHISTSKLSTYTIIDAHVKLINNYDSDIDNYIYYHFEKKK